MFFKGRHALPIFIFVPMCPAPFLFSALLHNKKCPCALFDKCTLPLLKRNVNTTCSQCLNFSANAPLLHSCQGSQSPEKLLKLQKFYQHFEILIQKGILKKFCYVFLKKYLFYLT